MNPREGHGPLVVFTTLAITGAGAIAAIALFEAPGTPFHRLATIAGLVLVASGLAVSVSHLGRRERAALASRGVRPMRGPGSYRAAPSAISIEGAMGVIVLVAGAAAASGGGPAWARPYVPGAAGLAAAAFLLSIGFVYRLKGQLTWTGPTALTPLTAGLAFGATLTASLADVPVSTGVVSAIAVDAFVCLLRWRQVTSVALEHPVEADSIFDRRHELLAVRFLLLDALPCVSLFVWPTPLAAAIAGAGVAVDRFGFYALARQHRTELEIARVERHLGAGSQPGR